MAGKFKQSAHGRRLWPGALRRVGVARAAGAGDQNRSDPEIGGVARGRLDADFHRDARMASAATPQSLSAMRAPRLLPPTMPTRISWASGAIACGKEPHGITSKYSSWL
jgi:hypothetical protein